MPEPAEGVQRTLAIVLQLAALLCRLQSQSSLEDDTFRRAAYRLVHLDLRGPRGKTCLHLACGHAPPASRQALGAVCQEAFPAPPLVRLLLELGANPNATDHDRRTPLHVAARNKPFSRASALALLARGAHLDHTDAAGCTPLDYAPMLVDCSPLRYTGLQCLCARAIVRFQLPFQGLVPHQLESFIQSH
ncbi:protein fem-1 homolog A-like [Rhipicephalus microplus]|uniref:protein fem-1 homolog A-like n=1 Tax=Rhipicephalus microplus TaxID=6941 RepID=UPI003F6BA001